MLNYQRVFYIILPCMNYEVVVSQNDGVPWAKWFYIWEYFPNIGIVEWIFAVPIMSHQYEFDWRG